MKLVPSGDARIADGALLRRIAELRRHAGVEFDVAVAGEVAVDEVDLRMDRRPRQPVVRRAAQHEVGEAGRLGHVGREDVDVAVAVGVDELDVLRGVETAVQSGRRMRGARQPGASVEDHELAE
ncbi:MAG: hypothetical protein IPG84_19880 [Betaproteobacteria bacterium]|nr:hypothetical protein [Betaproteobacteria bacterium]